MRKIAVIIFLAGMVLITSAIYAISYLNYLEAKNANIHLQEKINMIDSNNKNEEKNNVTLNENIKVLEEELKEEINTYNLWLNTKEKIILALS
ncbi:MAG: hypothetical protein IJO43_03290 [Bacilli bacterium]|nr:hypothetical protein [Bacilli bacterium]